MTIRRAWIVAQSALALAMPNVVHAQGSAQNAQTAGDSLAVRRAQRLLNDGDSTAARAILDSLVATTRAGTPARADALYWRALAASDASAAKRDLLTIALDYALYPRAADALLKLGRDAQLAGDRQTAIAHLERLVLEHPLSDAAADGWFALGRARMDEGNLPVGCAAFDSAQRRLSANDVERRRQVQFAAQSCRAIEASRPPATTTSVPPTAPPATPPATPPVLPPTPPPARGAADARASRAESTSVPSRTDTAARAPRWSAQIAAYKLQSDAERLVQSLKARGFDARVDESSLYRVRVGTYRTRADAAAMVAKLKAQKINAFVVEAAPRGP